MGSNPIGCAEDTITELMKAVILAAGEGIRMRPLTLHVPKPLLTVKGLPLLHHLLVALPENITEIVIVVGYLGEKIKNHFGEEYLGKKIAYVEQPEKKGTFSALQLCEPLLSDDEPFCVFYADDLLNRASIDRLLEHRFAVLVKKSEHPERFGVVSATPDGKVLGIIEKPEQPTSNLIVTNGCILDKNVFCCVPPPHANGELYLSAAIHEMAKKHDVYAVSADFWFPIGTPEDLKTAEGLIKNL